MNYPNYPQQPPAQQPQPGYFQGQQPAAYPPPQQQGYPPQQQQAYYPPPQQQFAPPPAQHLNASIDDFYDQPAASGKSIASWFQTPGQSITGMVARPISKADLRPQTDMQTKQPKHFSDGRPMITMTIPLQVQPTADFPDGRAAWIISSSDREDLDVAMQAAGCAARTVPEAGALITITFMGFKQIPGFGAPKKVKQIKYTRPQGTSAPEPAPQTQFSEPSGEAAADMVNGNGNVPNGQYAPQPPVQYATAPPALQTFAQSFHPQQPTPDPYAQSAMQPQGPPFAAPVQQLPPGQYVQASPVQQTYTPPPVPNGQPPQGAPEQQWAAPADLTAEQANRLRELTGN
jgi:hypothetical protein